MEPFMVRGHNSVLQEGDNYYIVYHRHDNPHSNRGFHRQVAIDKLEFNADGTIKEVIPTHEGLDLKPEMKVAKNLAFGTKGYSLFLLRQRLPSGICG